MNATRHTLDRNSLLLSEDELEQLLAISLDLENDRAISKRASTHHLYMQFLRISLAKTESERFSKLTRNEQHLLEQIAVRCEINNPINVSEACQMRRFGCISTVNHQIQKLSSLGLINLDSSGNDRRKKFINLSARGIEYFKQIEDCLDSALMS